MVQKAHPDEIDILPDILPDDAIILIPRDSLSDPHQRRGSVLNHLSPKEEPVISDTHLMSIWSLGQSVWETNLLDNALCFHIHRPETGDGRIDGKQD